MKARELQGVIIAMPTPLLKNEDIDVSSLHKLIEYVIKEGAHGIMIGGTMGEGTALTDSQRRLLVETTVDQAKGRIPILATVSAVSTRRSIEFTKTIDQSGADFMVCTTPFYNKFPDSQSILLHMSRIADATSTPLVFYNAPGATGNEVDADTADKILNMDRVAGIKDSSINYSNFMELLRRYPNKDERPGFIMQGDEAVFDSSLLMGADGVVSGGGVVFIKELIALYRAATANDKPRSFEHQRLFTKQLTHLLGENSGRDWVFNIKKRLHEMGVIDHAYVTSPFLMQHREG